MTTYGSPMNTNLDRRGRLCMSCLQTNTHSEKCPDLAAYTSIMKLVMDPGPPVVPGYTPCSDMGPGLVTVTLPDVRASDPMGDALSWTGVINALEKGPQIHAETSGRVPGVPVWTLVCIFLGLVLMGFGMARDLLDGLIWAAIPR